MQDTKRKRFIYKTATFLQDLGDPAVSLETLLVKALKKLKKAVDRRYNPQQDGLEYRLINYSLQHLGNAGSPTMYGCEFLAYEKGADQPTLDIDPDAEEIDVSALRPEGQKEFLSGSVYFAVYKNHMVLTSSRGFGSQELEGYLNWLLVEKAKVLPKENAVQLDDHIPDSTKAKMKGVKDITFSAPVHWTVNVGGPGQAPSTSSAVSVSPKAGEGPWGAFQAFLGKAVKLPSKVKLSDVTETPEIQVKLVVSWKPKHGEDDISILDGIASNLRHIDDEIDYTVLTKSGQVTRDDFKQFKHFNVNWVNGRPRFDELFPKMALWLAYLVQNDMIDV